MFMAPHRYFIAHKPYDMVSQFISPHKVKLLSNLNYTFPAGTHAIGRLDKNSEGLLILTTNKQVTRLLFQSKIPHKRTYLVQTEHTVNEDAINQLRSGVNIRIKGGSDYITAASEVLIAGKDTYKMFLQANENTSGSWILIILNEGKYHQVRKMFKAVHHRCKRLIRVAIDEIELGELKPGSIEEIDEKKFYLKLKIKSEEK